MSMSELMLANDVDSTNVTTAHTRVKQPAIKPTTAPTATVSAVASTPTMSEIRAP